MILPDSLLNCVRCNELVACRSQVVPPYWMNQEIDKPLVMLVGRNPGRLEDQEGRPFVGRAGKLLHSIVDPMAAVVQLYFTNLNKCWTPNDRPPTANEIENCKPYLDQEIQLLQPAVVVLFGREAQGYKFKKEDRSTVYYDSVTIWTSTYHPSYAARGNKDAEEQISRDVWGVVSMAVKIQQAKLAGVVVTV